MSPLRVTRPRATPDRFFLAGLIIAAIVYSYTLTCDFILDDVHLILLNTSLHSWSQWTIAFTDHVWAFHDPPVTHRHYRPVFVLWLLLNKQLFHDITPWWHLTSLLLHLLATTLVYRLGVRLVKDDWTAAAAAVIFALHPVHIESVAWVSASTDLLTAVFMLGSLICYLRFREPSPDETLSRWWLAASLSLATAAMLTKETAAVFPAVIFFYEFWRHDPARRGASLRSGIIRSLPFAAVVISFIAVSRLVISPSGSVTDADRSNVLSSLPIVAAEYAKTLAWPFQLSFFYSPEALSRWTPTAAFFVTLLLLGLFALWRLARAVPSSRLPLLWLAVFAVPPLASIALYTRDNWVHDRHMYLPSVGFCLVVAMLPARLKVPARNIALAVVNVVFALALAFQLPRFANELTLYEHAMRRAPTNVEMRLAYADALQLHGRALESQQEYERIVKMAPHSVEAHTYLGIMYDDLGHTEAARTTLQHAVRIPQANSGLRKTSLFRLGVVELKLGDLLAAETHLRAALEVDPQGWNFHGTLAEVLRRQGRIAEAEHEMQLEEKARKAFTAKRARS